MRSSARVVAAAIVALAAAAALAAEPQATADLELLAKALERTVAVVQGKVPAFTATFSVRFKDGETEQAGEATLTRVDAEQFGLALKSDLVSFVLVRAREATRLAVPAQKLAVVGKGPMPPESDLSLGQVLARAMEAWPNAATAAAIVQAAEPMAVAVAFQTLFGVERVPETAPAVFQSTRAPGGGKVSLELSPDGKALQRVSWRDEAGREVAIGVALREEAALPHLPTGEDFKTLSPAREEVERALGRGIGRALELLAQSQTGSRLRNETRTADQGRLVVRDGVRVAMLQGSPLEVGYQHGKLLAKETRRVADSVLYVAGLYYTVTKREWFLDTLRAALKRVEPHVPQEYWDEIQGLANGSGISPEEARLASVFPELFHCSGFALFGKATAGGKLLHGRVLDYMMELGLQREAVVFVVKKKNAIPFANVGYAGFTGCVSGMNAEQVAFGEMGGKGEGQWDGTPMGFLMRMGLERAKTLDDAIRIFREAKRTCEYYYVISDGKGPSAVGVAATPDRIEFIQPGEAHPKLAAPVEDAVLMSAGARLAELVKGAKAKHGQFDEAAAIALMKRPVAMRDNLHNVLFVPQDLAFHVANAKGRSPACDQPYARHSLPDLLDEMSKPLPPPPRRPRRGGGLF
ncbi:MAG: hypothetical protein FJ290_26080 [Planctomycetes bacterium]|nr:hypothetical protein [Planctomycetota bacterium]